MSITMSEYQVYLQQMLEAAKSKATETVSRMKRVAAKPRNKLTPKTFTR